MNRSTVKKVKVRDKSLVFLCFCIIVEAQTKLDSKQINQKKELPQKCKLKVKMHEFIKVMKSKISGKSWTNRRQGRTEHNTETN